MKKTTISFFLAILLILSGCKEKVGEEKSYFFLFVNPLEEHPIWQKAEEGFLAACNDLDVYCESNGPAVIDTKTMDEIALTGLVKGVDAVITQGVISESTMYELQRANIPVIFVDSDLPKTNRLAIIKKSFDQQARILLEDIIEKYQGQDLVIGIQVANLGFDIALDQIASIKKVFQEYPGNFEIVSITESKSEMLYAKKEWETELAKHPNINVAINLGAEGAKECSDVVYNTGIRDNILIYGVDDMEDTINNIRLGRIDGTIATSFFNYGYDSVKIAFDYLKDNKTPPKTEIDAVITLVDINNVDTYQQDLQRKK